MAFPKQRLIKYWILILVLLLLIPLLQRLDNNQPDPQPEVLTADGHRLAVFPSIQQTLKRLPLTPAPATLPIERWQTANGAEVLFLPAPEIDMIDIRLLFDAGSARDGLQPGLAQMTNGMLAEGSQQHSADQIAAGFEAVGAQFSNGSHRDMAILSLRSLSHPAQLQPALNLFTEVLAQPRFASDDLERTRTQALTYLRYQEQQPGAQANKAFFQGLYGTHPYAHPSSGTVDSLSVLTPEDLKRFHRQYYVARNLTIALVGRLDPAEAKALAETISSALPEGQQPAPLPAVAPPEALTQQLTLPTEQTTVLVGTLGVDRQDPDYPALYLANHILGGNGFSSRLMQTLREERGLTYGASSGLTPMHSSGPFMISFKTRNDQVDQALSVLHQELERFAREGPTADELDHAKRNILGSYPLGIASNASLVAQLGVLGFYDLPSTELNDFLERISALDAAEVQTAIARILQQPLIEITAGQPQRAQESQDG